MKIDTIKISKAILTTVLLFGLLLISFNISSAQETATNETDTVREKVREKVEQAKNSPKAFLGTITDITNNTLQISNKNEDIQQISFVEEETSFVQTNDTSKKITLEDIAIGDYIIAMGYENGDGILEAKRIVSTTESTLERRIITGVIKEIKNKQITITQTNGVDYAATFPKRWKGPEIDELEISMKVIIVLIEDEDTQYVRTIQITSDTTPAPTHSQQDEQ